MIVEFAVQQCSVWRARGEMAMVLEGKWAGPGGGGSRSGLCRVFAKASVLLRKVRYDEREQAGLLLVPSSIDNSDC